MCFFVSLVFVYTYSKLDMWMWCGVVWCGVRCTWTQNECMYVHIHAVLLVSSHFPYAARCWLWFLVVVATFCYFFCSTSFFNDRIQQFYVWSGVVLCVPLFIKPLAIALGWFSWINNVRRNGCLCTRTRRVATFSFESTLEYISVVSGNTTF